jgi:hypothetical protein
VRWPTASGVRSEFITWANQLTPDSTGNRLSRRRRGWPPAMHLADCHRIRAQRPVIQLSAVFAGILRQCPIRVINQDRTRRPSPF